MLPETPRATWGIWLLEGVESMGIVAVATVLMALGLERMTAPVTPPPPIETRFIEVAPPEMPEALPAPPRPAPSRLRSRPRPHDHDHMHPVVQPVRLAPPIEKAPSVAMDSLAPEVPVATQPIAPVPDATGAIDPAPHPGEPVQAGSVPEEDVSPVSGPLAARIDDRAEPLSAGEAAGDGTGWARETRAAIPLSRPEPDWPEALRVRTVHAVAGARFTIPATGAVRVELTRGTGDPVLDRFLVRSLGRWTFQPAVREGLPIDSVVELRVPVDIE